MAKELTDDSASFPASVTCPEAGDPRTAASVEAGLQDLANRTANLKSGSVTFSGQKIFSSNVGFSGAAQFASTSLFSGDATFDQNVEISSPSGNLDCNGSAVFDGAVTVNNNVEILAGTGNLECNGTATFADSLAVTSGGSVVVQSGASITAPEYELSAAATRRRLLVNPMYEDGVWSPDTGVGAPDIQWAQGLSSISFLLFPIDVPVGAKITGWRVYFQGAGTPATKPTYQIGRFELSGGAMVWVPLGAVIPDTSGTYTSIHFHEETGLSITTADDRRYCIAVSGASGAGFSAGGIIHSAYVDFEMTKACTG